MNARLAFVALLFPLAASAAESSPPKSEHFLREGAWATRMVIDREGTPRQTMTHSRCIAAADVEKEELNLFQPFPTGCKGEHHADGKTIRWTYSCVGPPPMKGSGELTYGKDEYSGTSESFADLGGKSLRLTRTKVEFKARRTGDCAAVQDKPGKSSKRRSKTFKAPISASPDVTASIGSTAAR